MKERQAGCEPAFHSWLSQFRGRDSSDLSLSGRQPIDRRDHRRPGLSIHHCRTHAAARITMLMIASLSCPCSALSEAWVYRPNRKIWHLKSWPCYPAAKKTIAPYQLPGLIACLSGHVRVGGTGCHARVTSNTRLQQDELAYTPHRNPYMNAGGTAMALHGHPLLPRARRGWGDKLALSRVEPSSCAR